MAGNLHVAFLATECAPLVKVGGLADVIGALPNRLVDLGVDVDVVIPRSGPVDPNRIGRVRTLEPVRVSRGDSASTAEVHTVDLGESSVRVFFIEDGSYFPRRGVYVDPATGREYPDQLERWTFFQRAALRLLSRESPDVDLFHCHEHQTALVPAYLDALYRGTGVFEKVSTVFTIHNLGYQGSFPARDWPSVGLDEGEIRPGGRFEYYGRINLMKGGILGADAVTAVSPTYAEEIQSPEYGCGLEGVIRSRRDDLTGILNGINDDLWNPARDTMIAERYSPDDLSGKHANRRALLDEFGLEDDPPTGPVLAMVSRLDQHKGFDLLVRILHDLLGEDVRFLLLGTGDASIEKLIAEIVRDHPGKAGLHFAFDDAMAHRVMAGSDIFLMPSRYEPCGLTQMYALRYGTVPVVRRTGGLADTVEEFDAVRSAGTGFCFSSYDPNGFREAIDRAIHLWHEKGTWTALMRNGMAKDFSWHASARRYIQVYDKAVSRRR